MPSLRFALRRWRSRPGLALIAIAILAIGIGATTAMFSIVNAVLLKDEPWADADRLVRVYGVLPQQRANSAYATTWNRDPITWQAWREAQKLPMFEDVAAWVPDQQVIGDAQTELVRTFMASSTLPLLLGAKPERGRFFNADEDEADSGTVIISHRLWARLFESDPDIVGKITNVTSAGLGASQSSRRTIVGVLPAGFLFPGDEPDILIPIGYHRYNGSFGNSFIRAMGRLRSDATTNAAESAVEPLVRGKETPDRRTARVVTLRFDRIGFGDRSLWLMFAGAGLLLLVACSNVAGLLLSDARSRQHETAVRLALGGTRGAILRAVMTEHAVLAVVAAISGVLLAVWLIPLLGQLAPPGLIGDQIVGLDSKIAVWAIAASILTILIAGLVPAFAVSAALPGHALKTGGREATRGSRWRHRVVVAAQFGLALVLIVGAGLFGETLFRLGHQSLGFSPEHVVVASVASARPGPRAALSLEERAQMDELRRTDIAALLQRVSARTWAPVQSLIDRLSGLPGVTSVAVADAVPFTSTTAANARLRGRDQRPEDAQLASYVRISAGYFDAMGIPVLRGRAFDVTDRGPTEVRIPKGVTEVNTGPAVISEELENRAFGGNGVGQTVAWGTARYTVVGVVANVKQRGPSDDTSAVMYIPASQVQLVRQIVVRTSGAAAPLQPAIRRTIEGHDTPMFVTSTVPLSDLVASTIAVERSRALLSGVYGLVALLLASVGLYGLAARLVAERRREIGIRVALGAAPRDVRRLVMTDAWMIVGIGLIVGVPTAIAASRFAEGLLYGVTPAAPHVIAIAVGALAIAAITATIVPAWRANRVDPIVVLREE